MKIEVFGDIVFLINFCMDYILLAFMCKILVCNSSRLRLFFASSIGGLYAIIAFYIPIWLGVPLQIVCACVMCIVTSPCKTVRGFMSRLAVFCALALVFGGGTLAVLCSIGADVLVKNGAFYIDINLKILTAATLICIGAVYVLEYILKHSLINCRRTVTIGFMGKKAVLRGYVDTGNTLTSGGVPIVLASWESVQKIMPDNSQKDTFYTKCPPERVSAVPYKYVGGEGIIWCITPDYIHINNKSRQALVGICPHTLSSEYDALLYTSM